MVIIENWSSNMVHHNMVGIFHKMLGLFDVRGGEDYIVEDMIVLLQQLGIDWNPRELLNCLPGLCFSCFRFGV